MSLIARPNAWVAVDDDPQTQLTYAPRVDPAPLTVSVPGRDPTLGSLVVVITNQTASDVAVASVTLAIVVGTPGVDGAPLTPTSAGVETAVSDDATWSFAGPSAPVSKGIADFVLSPQAGSSAKIAAGTSVVVEIYGFATVPAPGTSTVTVTEALDGGATASADIAVSTFPDGFYFDSLTVNVRSGSALVPVAQVANPTGVTLTWNSSLVDTGDQTVYWSSATAGQQEATPSKLGEWSTPEDAPLTSDTVFVVVVEARGVGGEQLAASLAASVSVRNPALVAASLSSGSAAVTGDLSVGGGLSAAAANVSGAVTAGSATVTGALSSGALTAAGATVDGDVKATGEVQGASVAASGSVQAGSLSTGTATVTSALDAQSGTVTVMGAMQTLSTGTFMANTDGLVIGYVPYVWNPNCGTFLTASCAGTTVGATGGETRDAGPISGSFTLPVPSGQQVTISALGMFYGAAAYSLWFLPFGKPAQDVAALELIGEAPPVSSEELAAMTAREAAREEIGDLLEQAIGRQIDEDVKQRLATALRGA